MYTLAGQQDKGDFKFFHVSFVMFKIFIVHFSDMSVRPFCFLFTIKIPSCFCLLKSRESEKFNITFQIISSSFYLYVSTLACAVAFNLNTSECTLQTCLPPPPSAFSAIFEKMLITIAGETFVVMMLVPQTLTITAKNKFIFVKFRCHIFRSSCISNESNTCLYTQVSTACYSNLKYLSNN